MGYFNKRAFYLFLDKLALSKPEMRFIIMLSLVICLLTLFKIFLFVYPNQDTHDYSFIDSLVTTRIELMEMKYDSIVQIQYFPKQKPNSSIVKEKLEFNSIGINSAKVKDFELLPGIGEKTAQKIIEYRKLNGAFYKLEDLMKVKGIGNKKFEKLKAYIKLN